MRNNSAKTLIALIAVPFFLVGCNEKASEDIDETATSSAPTGIEATPAEQTVAPVEIEKSETSGMAETTLVGTIIYKAIEGGFFAFIDESGAHYTLHNLEAVHKKDGLIVRISGTPQPDMMTITQFGTVFKVSNVEVLDDSAAKTIIQNNPLL